MKITGGKVHVVSVPYEAPTLASIHTRKGITRTILLLDTDEGLVGLGEGQGGTDAARALESSVLPALHGLDPHSIQKVLSICEAAGVGPRLYQAVEVACWDIMGKACGRPVSDLIGGAVRETIPVAGYLFYRGEGPNGEGGEHTPWQIVQQASTLAEKHGFTAFKLKAGVMDPSVEIETMRLLRRHFGDQVRLRIDPNAKWSVADAITYLGQLTDLGLEWAEDPTAGIDGMAQVRSAVPIPLATNMAVTTFPQLLPAREQGAVDVVLGDPGIWGGIWHNKRLEAMLACLGLGMGMHSTGHLGITAAASLHLVASARPITAAIDSHSWLIRGDIVTGPDLRIRGGVCPVPRGPGLGVTLDTDALAYFTGLHARVGDFYP